MNIALKNALIALQEQSACLWFGKYFMHCLGTGHTSFAQVTINYPDQKSFYTAIGVLTGKGYTGTFQDGSATFRIAGTNLLLRRKEVTVVADFDYLCYDLQIGGLYYQGSPLSPELGAKFAVKKCSLVFDPYQKQDDSQLWLERRKAMLSYIEHGWTLLDNNDNPVSFVNVEKLATELDPHCLWFPVKNSSVEPTVAVKTKLTMEGFHQELSELIAKYADVLVNTSIKPSEASI